MKIIILTISLFYGLSAYSQDIDENGRTKGAKASLAFTNSDNNQLSKSTLSTSNSTVLNYNLPSGLTSGKIVLFHPKKDLEIKLININSNSGSVSVDLVSLGMKSFTAVLYSNGKLIKSLKVD